MPSAPTIMSASISLPSAKRATPPRSHCSTAMQRAPKRKVTVLSAPHNTSSKSARCTVRLGAPNCWRNAPRRIREMIRPLFQLRMTRKSDSHPRAMTWCSTPRTRSAMSALGLRLRPVPISFSAGDCSQTTISAPRLSSASAVASPPTPPPTMAMRGTRLIQAVQVVDVRCRIPTTAHLCPKHMTSPDMTISSLRSRDILQRAGTRLNAPEPHNNDLEDHQPNHQPDHARQAVVDHQEADDKGGRQAIVSALQPKSSENSKANPINSVKSSCGI